MYATSEVAERSGVSARRLDRWARLGVLVPSVRNEGRGKGRGRRYSDDDLRAAVALGKLSDLLPVGVPVETARSVVAACREQPGSEVVVEIGGQTLRIVLAEVAA